MARTPCPKRNSNSIMLAPARTEPLVERVAMDSKFFSPLRNSKGFSIEGNSSVGARIIHLLGSGRPTTIIWAVAKIIVDSFKSHARTGFAHIGEEIRKIMPVLAEDNPARAIIFESWVIGVAASLFNSKPNPVQSSARFAMLCISLVKSICARAAFLAMQATTRLRHSSFKVVAPNLLRCATITNAQTIFSNGLNNEPTKTLTNNNWVGFFSWHKFSSIVRNNYNTNNRRLSNAF